MQIVSTTEQTSPPSSTSLAQGTTSKLSTGAAAGIGVGSAFGFVLLTLLGWLLYRSGVRKGVRVGANNLAPAHGNLGVTAETQVVLTPTITDHLHANNGLDGSQFS